jgi:hypothetical protein
MSIRTQIRNYIEQQLKTITKAAGYNTDVGSNIDVWRPGSKPWESDKRPAAVVNDIRREIVQETQAAPDNQWHQRLTVAIEITCGDIATYTLVIDDIYALFKSDHTLGGLAIDTNSTGDQPDVDQEEMKLVGGTLYLIVDYVTERFVQ